MKRATLLLCLLILVCFIQAQRIGDMDSERGRQTKSAVIVQKGIFQLETGFNYIGDRELGTKTSYMDYLGSLLRLGVTKNLEVRVESGYSRFSIGDIGVTGMKPVKFGLKSQLAFSDGRSTDMSIILAATPANSGSAHFSNTKWGFDCISAFGWHIDKSMRIGANIGVLANGFEDELVVPISANWSFPLDYDWTGYAELAGEIIKNGHSNILAGAGLTYDPSNHLQFDTYIGKGLNDDAKDWFFTIGFSWRMGPLFR
jgi:hypothetical protein